MTAICPRKMSFTFVVFVVWCLALTKGQPIVDTRFTNNNQCPGKVVEASSRYRTLAARSSVECIARCRPDERCVAMVYDPSARLCHLANATARPDCSNMVSPETSLKYYESKLSCQNGGELNSDGTCKCVGSYVGDTCGKLMEDCEEGYLSGQFTSFGVYTIKPAKSATPFQVYCRMLQTKTPTTVLSRTSTATSFNRTWQEYKDGFGDASGDYFIGLERLHQLTTSKDYELRFRVRLDNKTNYYQYYRSFVLNDESENYSFTFNYTLHFQVLGDCLGNLQGVGFSAFDRDNDGDSSINCAQQNGGGWWFSGASCSSCSPLGLILEPFDGWKKGVPGEAYWDGVLGDVLPFTFSMYVVI